MQFTKKFDRAFQWAGEKMGNEAKTSMSDDFKNLETEMALRHDGMDRLQKSMNVYVKSVSKRCETSEDKEKGLPIGYMGRTMAAHGEDFEPDSEFGNCLIVLGRANEQLASTQEAYVQQATSYWLESLERSLAMMKEYQSARRKLENRRLAYDASTTKVQKAKREDFRLEDELRAAKAKYEESSEDVLRRMQDIKEAEAETVQDLTSFLDAELDYHERCAEELRRARQQWPAGASASAVPVIRGPRPDAEPPAAARRPSTRSRSGTAHSHSDRTERWASSRDIYEEDEAEAAAPPPAPGPRPAIRSHGRLSVSGAATPVPVSPPRPGINRSSTYGGGGGGAFEGPAATTRSPGSYREPPPLPQDSGMRKANTTPAAVVAPPPPLGSLRGNLRPVSRISTGGAGADVFGDDYDTATSHSGGSPEYDRAESPATSYGSLSRTTSNVALQPPQQPPSTKKAPPPPPPSRAKKPPPPIPQKSGLIR